MGETYFTNAFKEAKTIIDNINRNEHIPVIILLTDGHDYRFKRCNELFTK